MNVNFKLMVQTAVNQAIMRQPARRGWQQPRYLQFVVRGFELPRTAAIIRLLKLLKANWMQVTSRNLNNLHRGISIIRRKCERFEGET